MNRKKTFIAGNCTEVYRTTPGDFAGRSWLFPAFFSVCVLKYPAQHFGLYKMESIRALFHPPCSSVYT